MNSSWQWDESIPVGKDFFDRSVVAAYDARHRSLRDIDGENATVLANLNLKPDQIVVDFGCGTGAFARQAARQCATVVAIDISAAMLDFVAWKAHEEGFSNIVCRRGGFLTYVHEGPLADAIHTSLALHHLPDFWKQKALSRLFEILQVGGRLHLMDVVFQEEKCDQKIDAWITQMEAKVGKEMADSLRDHIRKEYSTFTWILEGMLERAGFRIDHIEHADSLISNYYCTKVGVR